MSGKICEDGSSLEDGEVVAIMIHNGWDSTVGGVFREPRLLLDVLPDIDTLPDVVLAISSLQFLQDNRRFVSIRRSPGKQLDARFGNEASRSV